jgi:hypothetical protein
MMEVLPMTPFHPPTTWIGHELRLDVRLCAEGESTHLESAAVADPDEIISFVLDRYGLPDAVLRNEANGLMPIGWVVPAPPSPSTDAVLVGTAFGEIATPAAYIEIRPTIPGFGFRLWPILQLLLDDPVTGPRLVREGLIDAADAVVPALWDEYRAASSADASPSDRFAALLSVHRRARSAGVMQLAAHAADTAGELLHRAGDVTASLAMHRWAYSTYGRIQARGDRAVAMTNIAHSLWHDGQLEAAAKAGEFACGIADMPSLFQLFPRAAMTAAYPLADLGRHQDAVRLLERCGELEDDLALGWWHHARAYVAVAAGDTDLAGLHVRKALTGGFFAAAPRDAVESLKAAAFEVAASIARLEDDWLTQITADANAEIARKRLSAPFIH